MALTHVPQSFNVNNEEDLRAALILYFCDVGFLLTELKFEEHFAIQLGHNTFQTKKTGYQQRPLATGRSDLLLARFGHPVAIVETKAPGHRLTPDDAWQAISYARLLAEIAPFAIVTNGVETRVFDTFAAELTPLDDPEQSQWYQNGQRITAIGADLRDAAARTLVGLNPTTFHAFCLTQTRHAMDDLKGDPHELKAYVANLYVPCGDLQEAIDVWLGEKTPLFAIVGEGDMGKTNALCGMAETLANSTNTLFYSAGRLFADGLLATISNDFVWEFQRHHDPAIMVQRFAELCRHHGSSLVLFLDGLDEFPGERQILRNELLDLVQRLQGTAIHLCVSCNAFAWPEFVSERGRTYNRLAACLPQKFQPHYTEGQFTLPDVHLVGYWLTPWTDEDLAQVFPKYQSIYHLQGDLRGATREACRTPAILRLVAEIYSQQPDPLPSDIAHRTVLERYWQLQLAKVVGRQRQLQLEHVLASLAKLLVEADQRYIAVADVENLLPTFHGLYEEIAHIGILRLLSDEEGTPFIGFGLELLRNYAYTVKSQSWPSSTREQMQAALKHCLRTASGFAAIVFYITVINTGSIDLLTLLALEDLPQFADLVETLPTHTSTPRDEKANLERYARTYAQLMQQYFPELRDRIEPKQAGDIGVWVSGDMYQLRIRTPEYPGLVTELPADIIADLAPSSRNVALVQAIRPGQATHYGLARLARAIPQRVAWQEIHHDLAQLIQCRALDESSAPVLLQERVWEILLNEPSMAADGVSAVQRFWQLLEYPSLSDLEQTTPILLLQRVEHLTQQRAAVSGSSSWDRYNDIHLSALHRLSALLHILIANGHPLAVPPAISHDLYEQARNDDLSQLVQSVTFLLPIIFAAYHAVVAQNLPRLAPLLKMDLHRDDSLLVEVARSHRRGFIALTYAMLPTISLPQGAVIYCQEGHETLGSTWVISSPSHGITSSANALGKGFVEGSLSWQVGQLRLDEVPALLATTLFPGHHPVTDQVYQLLSHELRYRLGGKAHEWDPLSTGTTNSLIYDVMLNRSLERYHANGDIGY